MLLMRRSDGIDVDERLPREMVEEILDVLLSTA
jgi:hypothetical protein